MCPLKINKSQLVRSQHEDHVVDIVATIKKLDVQFVQNIPSDFILNYYKK